MDRVMPKAQQLAVLSQMVGAGGVLATSTLVLFSKPEGAVSNNTTLASIVPTTYTGYADKVGLAWGAPFIGRDGLARIVSEAVQFDSGGVGEGDNGTVSGWALMNAAKTQLRLVGLLPEPVSMTNPDAAVIIQAEYVYGE